MTRSVLYVSPLHGFNKLYYGVALSALLLEDGSALASAYWGAAAINGSGKIGFYQITHTKQVNELG